MPTSAFAGEATGISSGECPRRVLLANDLAFLGRAEDSVRELQRAISQRPHDANILYNAACTFGNLRKKAEALGSLKMAKEFGYSNWDWVSRDPDLECLHDEPEFWRLLTTLS
jgi:hypothetical protein